jgi:outer membrane protein TolC
MRSDKLKIMRISPCWITLGASLAILSPTFTVNAQDANTNPTTYIPASRISQQQPKSNASLDGDFYTPKRPAIATLNAVNAEIPLKEIYPKATRTALIMARREKKLIVQAQQISSLEPATEKSAPQIPAPAPVVEPPSKKPALVTATPGTKPGTNPNTKIVPDSARSKLPSKKPALATATPAKSDLSSSVKIALESARAKLSGKDPLAMPAPTVAKPEASPSVKIETDSAQAKSPDQDAAATATAITTKPDTNQVNSVIIEPDSSKNPLDDFPKTVNLPIEAKNTKVAIGLDPRQPLVVPTTPSQVKIERNQPITLKEALEIADRNSPTIAAARIEVERAKALLDEQVAARNPTVSAQSSLEYANSAQSQASGILLPFGARPSPISKTLSSSVGINYNIYTSGRVDASIRAAENSLRSSEANFNRIAQTTRLSIATAYYSAQNADGQVRIREEQVKNNERSLQDTEALERAGVGTKFDVLQSQVELANARQNLSSAKASQATTRRELARQLSYPPNLDLFPADEIKTADDWKPSLEETILLALKNRSELDVQKLQREVARDNAKAALAALGPRVTLAASIDQFDNLNQVGGSGFGYTLAARLNWNLFDGGVANAQANQAEADRALAEVRFTEAGNQARFDVESAYNNLNSRREQIESTTLAVKQANEALRLSRLRLSAGVGTQLEVIRSQDALTQADVNRLDAIIGFNLSLVQLQRAINGL